MAPDITAADVTAAKPTGLAKTGSMPSRAFVTFLAGNGDYVKGVVGLAKGLERLRASTL
jgi:inositol 3-alpha-galactosyltransferase